MITRDVFTQHSEYINPIDYVQATNTVPLAFRVMDWTPEEEAQARVYILHSDNTAAYQPADWSMVDGKPVISFTPAISTFPVEGLDTLQCEFFNDEKTLVSFAVPVHVHKNCANGTKSGNNFSIFNKELNDIKHLSDTIAAVTRGVALSDFPRVSADAAVGKEIADLCQEWIDHRDELYYNLRDDNPYNLYTLWDYRPIENGKNDQGQYQIDCSSFVLAMMYGIGWTGSRYYLCNNGYPETAEELTHNEKTYHYGMSLDIDADDPYLPGNILPRYAHEIAKFAYEQGFAFKPASDGSNLCVGDILFITPAPPLDPSDTHWEHITHCGVYMGTGNSVGGGGEYIRIANAVAVSTSTVTSPLDYSYFNKNLLETRVWGAARFPYTPSGKQLKQLAVNTYDLTEQSSEHEIITTEPLIPGHWYTAALKATRNSDYYYDEELAREIPTTARLDISGRSHYLFPQPQAITSGFKTLPAGVNGLYVVQFQFQKTRNDQAAGPTVPTHVCYLRNGRGDAASAPNWNYDWLCIYEGICDVPTEYVKTTQDKMTPIVTPSVISADEMPQGYALSNQAAGAPNSNTWFLYQTNLNAARTLGSQTAVRLSDGAFYVRTLTVAGWSLWHQSWRTDTSGATCEDFNELHGNLFTRVEAGIVNAPFDDVSGWISVYTDGLNIQQHFITDDGRMYVRRHYYDTDQWVWSPWNIYTRDISGQDCDGLPNGDGIGQNMTNGPAGSMFTYIKTVRRSQWSGYQEAVVIYNQRSFFRTCYTEGGVTTWTPWTETTPTVYTAGDGIDITDNVITNTRVYTAGQGISIDDDNVISATGGGGGATYTAGRGISIENDEISLADATPTGTGLNANTLPAGDVIATGITNSPSAGSWTWIHTAVYGANLGAQIAVILGGTYENTLYHRTKVGGTWGAWKTSQDVTTP